MRAQRADAKDISRALWLCCHSALLAQEITQCRALLCWHSVLVRRKTNPVNYCPAPARHRSPVSQHTDTTACWENSKQTTLAFDCSATSRQRCCIGIEHCPALWPHFDRRLPLPHWWLFKVQYYAIVILQYLHMKMSYVYLQVDVENSSELMIYKCLNLTPFQFINKHFIYFVVKEDSNALWGIFFSRLINYLTARPNFCISASVSLPLTNFPRPCTRFACCLTLWCCHPAGKLQLAESVVLLLQNPPGKNCFSLLKEQAAVDCRWA